MKTMLFNPYTGRPRHPADIASDPEGRALIDPDEPVKSAPMPSNTRYMVVVEGTSIRYYDTIHDAITHAQQAVYAGPDNTIRAIDDLKAGRIAEWSYGFSTVRIYPPQKKVGAA